MKTVVSIRLEESCDITRDTICEVCKENLYCHHADVLVVTFKEPRGESRAAFHTGCYQNYVR